MSVMSIRIQDDKRKLLKILASVEGETISGIVSKLIDGYIEEKKGNIRNSFTDGKFEGEVKILPYFFLI